MDLDSLIITVFCLVDDTLAQLAPEHRLRQRGPSPRLADSQVLTIEIIGEYLGLDRERALLDYFRRHWSHYFPALEKLHRTTFTRQAGHRFQGLACRS